MPRCIAVCRLYQCNVCGEGGEYETLTLDCPLFKHARIVLDSWEAVHQSADAFAPVGHLHPVAYHLESKGPTGTSSPGVTPAATRPFMQPLQNPSIARHLESGRLTSGGTLPRFDPAPTQVCTEPPRGTSHSNSHTPQDSRPAASSRAPEHSSSKDCDLLAALEKASIQSAPDHVWAGAVVIEVPRHASRSIAAEAADAGTDTQSAEAARHIMPSMPSMPSRPGSVHAWSADVQVQRSSQYVRAVCCPVQQAGGLGSSKDTADALDCALAALQQGHSLPDVC